MAVLDFQDGQTFSVNGNVLHKTASAMKLFYIAAAIQNMTDGSSWYSYETLDPYIRTIFQRSTDEPAEWMLYYAGDGVTQRGGDRTNALMRQAGMNSSLLVHWDTPVAWGGAPGGYYYQGPYYAGPPVYGNNRFTALDVVRGLRALHDGLLFPKAYATRLLDQLDAQNGFYYLRRDLPLWRLWVADKVGWIAPESWGPIHQCTNDHGIVKILDRIHPATGLPVTYSLALFVQTDHREHTNAQAVDFIATLSLAIFEYYDLQFTPGS